MYKTKTYSIKASEIEKKWILIDGKDVKVGRLASAISILLMGKHKPTFTPHMDCGDNVIVVNARHLYFSGKKSERNKGKVYYRHTGYPGGIKQTTAGKILEGSNPKNVLVAAVKGMLDKNPLGRKRMEHLYIYNDDSHLHAAQKPELYNFANENSKNRRVRGN